MNDDPMSDAYWLAEQDKRVAELEAEAERLRSAIEDYSLWRPGERGHAAAHRRLLDAARAGKGRS